MLSMMCLCTFKISLYNLSSLSCSGADRYKSYSILLTNLCYLLQGYASIFTAIKLSWSWWLATILSNYFVRFGYLLSSNWSLKVFLIESISWEVLSISASCYLLTSFIYLMKLASESSISTGSKTMVNYSVIYYI